MDAIVSADARVKRTGMFLSKLGVVRAAVSNIPWKPRRENKANVGRTVCLPHKPPSAILDRAFLFTEAMWDAGTSKMLTRLGRGTLLP
jgi:hypothetical protein